MPKRLGKPDRALARYLRRKREEVGASQENIAFHAGVTTGTLARLELGQSDPAWSTVRAIAAALEITLQELAAGVEGEEGRADGNGSR